MITGMKIMFQLTALPLIFIVLSAAGCTERTPAEKTASSVDGAAKENGGKAEPAVSARATADTRAGEEFQRYLSKKALAEGAAPEIPGMVYVKGGCFSMGDIFGDGRENERPVHEVCLDGFYMDKYEVTQRNYSEVIGNNPSREKYCIECPAESVAYHEGREYCEKVGKRLPTEAEWEYAARSGGKSEKYSETDGVTDLGDYAWFRENSANKPHPVGLKKPNGLGLYDMSGNVAEWVYDRYDRHYYKYASRYNSRYNPQGPCVGGTRVTRGGNFSVVKDGSKPVVDMRLARRGGMRPGRRSEFVGFRCAKTRSSVYEVNKSLSDIPAWLASGTINGRPLRHDRASIKEGVLRLCGDYMSFHRCDELALEVHILIEKGAIPEGRTYVMEMTSRSPDSPMRDSDDIDHVELQWKYSSRDGRPIEFRPDKYKMRLEFGRETDGKLPGKIKFIQEGVKSKGQEEIKESLIAGTFEACIEGFRLVDGKPDLFGDTLETLQYAAELYLNEHYPQKPVKLLEVGEGSGRNYGRHAVRRPYVDRRGRVHGASRIPQTGWYVLVFRVGDGTPLTKRFQFVKDKETGWKVFGTLNMDQLPGAHPYEPPGRENYSRKKPTGYYSAVVGLLSARNMESNAQKLFPGKGIDLFSSKCKVGEDTAECLTWFKVEGEEKVRKAYQFLLDNDDWLIANEVDNARRYSGWVKKPQMTVY
jgi:formylglycine-generating enzyme required for sulfatase activity